MRSNSESLLAIIPARGGSKGLPRKNVLPLAGRLLIGWSIEAALSAQNVQRIAVTTDDAEIAEVARGYGVEVVLRPPELATDRALTIDAVEHAILSLRSTGDCPDHVVLLQPTSPLRRAAHIDEAATKYFSLLPASLISVVEEEHSVYKSFRMDETGAYLVPLFGEHNLSQPRQSLPKVYRQNGAIYITPAEALIKSRSFFMNPCLHYEMSSEVSVDIDTLKDLKEAEEILSLRSAL
jgi:CMP-N,N'-diacetyllegionaminic acid synthase